jgi:hypothetical protein
MKIYSVSPFGGRGDQAGGSGGSVFVCFIGLSIDFYGAGHRLNPAYGIFLGLEALFSGWDPGFNRFLWNFL